MFTDANKPVISTVELLTTLLVAIVTMSLFSAVHAQDGTNEQLLACDRMADLTEKMACFDAVVNDLKKNADETVVEASAESAADATGSNSSAAISATAATVAPNATATPAPEILSEPATAESAESVTPELTAVAGAAAIENPGPQDTEVATAGEVLKNEEKTQPIQATIVEAWQTIDGRFEVRLDNDQVWRETELTRINRVPKKGSTVSITEASMGSYRMKIGNNNRQAAVRRTK